MSDHGHPVDPERVAAAQARQLQPAEAERLSGLLSVLSDPMRARVLTALLATDELCVGDIALAADINEDAATYALRVLRMAGLVQRRRAGRFGYYRVADGGARNELAAALEQLRRLATRNDIRDEHVADASGGTADPV